MIRNMGQKIGRNLKNFRSKGSSALSITWIALVFFSLQSSANESKFDQANQLFEQGEFETSIHEYKALLSSGIQTSAVHFNLGNAYFRQDNTGMAIYHYLMAQTLDPRDADILANLKFTRDSAGLPSRGIVSSWRHWIRILPLNMWFILTLTPLWGFCLLKAIHFLTASRKMEGLRSMLGWMIIPSVCMLAFLTWSVSSQHTGVVIKDQAPLHTSPFTDSKTLGKMKAGEEVLLLAEKNQWKQIRNTQGELGWLEMNQLKAIPAH
jgi:tetratricopeptide (TPR) repeat protein